MRRGLIRRWRLPSWSCSRLRARGRRRTRHGPDAQSCRGRAAGQCPVDGFRAVARPRTAAAGQRLRPEHQVRPSAKDAVTREHGVRVGELAMRSGERVGLDPIALRAVGLGGLLHDVGKLVTPFEILTKPGQLTDDERAVVERHTIDGEAMLAPYPHLSVAAVIVRHIMSGPTAPATRTGSRGSRSLSSRRSSASSTPGTRWSARTARRPARTRRWSSRGSRR